MKTITIENKVGRVRLNDSVNPLSTDELIGDIERLYGQKAVAENLIIGGFEAKADDALEVLELDIHTPGGSVLDGYRIHNSLMQMRSRGVRVVATVNTLAASMGSVIIMAADEINIVPGGRIMIHEAQQTVSGDSADHERSAKILNEMSDEIAELYAERTGKSKEEMRELMIKETWMGAKEALERGFADFIVTQVPQSTEAKAETDTLDIQPIKPKPNHMKLIDRLTTPSKEESLAEIEALSKQLEGRDEIIASRDAQLEVAEAALQEAAEFKAQADAFSAEIVTLKADNLAKDEQVKAITAELEASRAETAEAKQSAGDEARETLAAIGQPEPLQVVTEEVTGDLLDQYESLKGAEKRDFLAIHAVELRRLALEKSNI